MLKARGLPPEHMPGMLTLQEADCFTSAVLNSLLTVAPMVIAQQPQVELSVSIAVEQPAEHVSPNVAGTAANGSWLKPHPAATLSHTLPSVGYCMQYLSLFLKQPLAMYILNRAIEAALSAALSVSMLINCTVASRNLFPHPPSLQIQVAI